MKSILLFPAFLLTISATAQQFINGGFEQTEAKSCEYNLSNKAFSDMMTSVYAFGAGDECDIQSSACGRSAAIEGKFFISLATRPNLSDADAIAIELDEPFVQGKSYSISWYERSSTELYSTRDSVIFTISDRPDRAGTRIHVAYPNPNNWLQQKLTFKAPISGKYLTIANSATERGWNFFDAFTVEKLAKIPQLTIESPTCIDFPKARLYGNVKDEEVTVNASGAIREIWLMKDGKTEKSLPGSGSSSQKIKTQNLEEGEYIVLIKTDAGFEQGKFRKE
jgi:hypothetical protein